MFNLPDNVTQRCIDAAFGRGLSCAAEDRLNDLRDIRLEVADLLDKLVALSHEDEDSKAYDDAISALENETLPSLNVRIRDIAQWDDDQSAPDYDAIRDLRRAA